MVGSNMRKLLFILAPCVLLSMVIYAGDTSEYKKKEVLLEVKETFVKTYVDIYVGKSLVIGDLEIKDPTKMKAEVVSYIKEYNNERRTGVDKIDDNPADTTRTTAVIAP